FVVTRVYNERYMAVSDSIDPLDNLIENERKVKQEYFELLDLDESIIPGLTYRMMLEGFVETGYFSKKEDGSYVLNFTEDTRNGLSPMWGLDLLFYPFSAID
ncbi:MAG: hypothetical protein MJ239_05235, partial [Bacilli bacterium]|nr:hypothetical protein [Bacilli bacterium]